MTIAMATQDAMIAIRTTPPSANLSIWQNMVPLKEYSALAADARAALRMIREVVAQNAPPGSVRSEDYVEPPFTKAEALVGGILAIVEAKC